MTAFGIIHDEPIDTYHGTDSVSASKLRTFLRKPGGPALYLEKYILKTIPREETDALRVGQALHTAVLEPEKLASSVVVLPKIDRRTAAGKLAYAQAVEQAAGKTILTEEQGALLRAMMQAYAGHPIMPQLMASGRPEVTLRIAAPGGFPHLPPIQVRPDWLGDSMSEELAEWVRPYNEHARAGQPYVLDLKTAASLDDEDFGSFGRGVQKHGYHVQAGLYLAVLQALGIDCQHFFFAACEKVPPHACEVYYLGQREVQEGQRVAENALMALDRCYARGEWPNGDTGLRELRLPGWYWRKQDESAEWADEGGSND